MFALLMGQKTISPAALDTLVRAKEVTVVDVNSPQSFREAHVPGAVNVDPAGFVESDLPADKDANLVFYCSNPMCRKAPSAARRASKLGYTGVKVMSAGISGWIAARLPTESAPRQ